MTRTHGASNLLGTPAALYMNMDIQSIRPSPENLVGMAETVDEFLTYYRQYGLATLSGSLSRTSRLYKQYTRAEAASWTNLSRSKNIWDTAARQADILSELYGAWTKELANTWQILLMAQADLEHWSARLARSATEDKTRH